MNMIAVSLAAAGFVVVMTEDISTMPGLPSLPAARDIPTTSSRSSAGHRHRRRLPPLSFTMAAGRRLR